MALFGLFKSKQERELNSALQQMNEMMFPRGEQDIARDCQRIDALTHQKIPQDRLRGFVAGCKALLHVSDSDDEARFIDSFMRRAEGRISHTAHLNPTYSHASLRARTWTSVWIASSMCPRWIDPLA